MFAFSLIALGLIAAAVVVALNASHIPGLRELTGAAPLLSDEEQAALDFAATKRAGHIESPDGWAARTGLQSTNRKESS